MLCSLLFPCHPIYMVGHATLGAWQRVTWSLCLPCMVGEGSSFPGLVPSNDVVDSESVMGIKPGNSGVVIGYQIGEFARTWSAEWFVAHSHIYLGFNGMVSSLTHFPWNWVVKIILFLDQAVADFENGLDSILTDSLPWMSLMPLHLHSLLGFFAWLVLFLIILNCSLLPA